MNIRVFPLACIFLFCLTTGSFSQDSNISANAEELFNLAAAKHKKELRSLITSRGADFREMYDATLQSVSEFLGMRKEEWQGLDYPNNTSVLFYSYEQDNLSIWLVNERGIKAYHKQQISEQQIAEAVSNLRVSLGVNRIQLSRAPHLRGAELASADIDTKISLDESLKKITGILIPKTIANNLGGTDHLIVVPVLGIGTVPYAMLKPFEKDSYLIDKMTISIAPSLTDVGHRLSLDYATNEFKRPLVVGNPYLSQDSNWIVPSLPGAEAEAQAVAQILETKPLLGKEATKKTILMRSASADLLYFASHGVADSNDPLTGGFLMLSGDSLENGRWTAAEIQNYRSRYSMSDVKLVVLSACQTGLGKVHNAGIIGLARAFQIAGAPRVVMSLWNVDDGATNELMQEFIKRLQTVNTASEALRFAILKVRKTRPDPAEWASFTVFGTPR